MKVPAETLLAAAGRSMIARRLMWRQIATAFVVALLFLSAAPRAFANQLVLNSTGGTATLGTDFILSASTVANPAGTLSIDCPITSIASGTYAITYDCSGGNFSYQSTDGTTAVAAPFGTAALTLTARAAAGAATFITTTASPAISAERRPSMALPERLRARPTRRLVHSVRGSVPER